MTLIYSHVYFIKSKNFVYIYNSSFVVTGVSVTAYDQLYILWVFYTFIMTLQKHIRKDYLIISS